MSDDLTMPPTEVHDKVTPAKKKRLIHLCVIILAAYCLTSSILLFSLLHGQSQVLETKLLRTQEIQLLSPKNGNQPAMLMTCKDDGSRIFGMYNTSGNPLIGLYIDPQNIPWVQLLGPDSKDRLLLTVNASGDPVIALQDNEGHPALRIGTTSGHASGLTFSKHDGKSDLLSIGVDQLGRPLLQYRYQPNEPWLDLVK